MRFNSYEFVFLFLPVVWLGWRGALRLIGPPAGMAWLVGASLFFYAWWDWRFVPLLAFSLVINFALGRRLAAGPAARRTAWLVAGLCWNLGLLFYFKYWNFFLDTLRMLTPATVTLSDIVLPLGISFFTFQKIAFLVDVWRGQVKDVRFLDFALFVLFFPQLIAGPIVHHGEFIPQLREDTTFRLDPRKCALGLSLFAAGLFQKCVIADTLAPVADSAFGLAAHGTPLRLVEAWTGLLAYSLQLFNDFSGYSHMAIGLALLFGLRLPVNFAAPYTARSVIEFWRRWHITLSRFLRDYCYIPLGGNRHGPARQLLALFVTMALAGLWHGAGWTFVLWGVWHGAALCVNHLWHRWRADAPPATRFEALRDQALTLAVVVLGWVLFRSPDLATVRLMGESLFGLHGISVPTTWLNWIEPFGSAVRARGLFPSISAPPLALLVLLAAAVGAVAGPRLLRWLQISPADTTASVPVSRAEMAPADAPLHWKIAVATGLMLALSIAALAQSSPFLYFQF